MTAAPTGAYPLVRMSMSSSLQTSAIFFEVCWRMWRSLSRQKTQVIAKLIMILDNQVGAEGPVYTQRALCLCVGVIGVNW